MGSDHINKHNDEKELAAGKRQVNVFNALMVNFDKAISATSSAYDSLNSAQEENARFMDSIQGRLNNFQSAWQQLANNTISSEFIKDVVDLGTAMLHLTDKIGGVGVAMGLLTTVSMLKFREGFATLLPVALGGFIKKLQSAGVATATFETILKSTTVSATLLKAVLGGLIVTAVVAGFVALYNALNNTTNSFNELNDEIDKNKTKINELTSEVEALRSKGDITEEEKERLALLEKELELRERAAKAQEREKAGYVYGSGGFPKPIQRADRTWEIAIVYKPDEDNEFVVQEIVDDLQQIPQKIEEINAKKLQAIEDDDLESVDEYNEQLLKLEDKLVQATSIGQEAFNGFTKAVENNYVPIEDVKKIYDELGSLLPYITQDVLKLQSVADESNISIGESFNTLGSVLTEMKNNLTGLVKVWDEYNSAGEISVSTLLDMINNYPDLLSLLELQNGQYVLNRQAVEELFQSEKDKAVAKLEEDKAELQSMIKLNEARITASEIALQTITDTANAGHTAVTVMKDTTTSFLTAVGESAGGATAFMGSILTKLGGMFGDTSDIEKWKAENEELKNELAKLDEQIAYVSNLTLPDFSSKAEKAGSSASKAAKQTDELTDANKELKDALEKAEDKLGDYTNKMDAYFNQITDALDDEIADLEKANEKLEQMGDLFNAFGDYIVEGLEDEIEAIDKAAEAEKDRLQDKLDALEEEEKLNDRNKKLEEARLNIAQAQEALERAKRQKVHIYRDKTGFVYETDFSSVSSAQDQLDEAQGKYDDLVGEYEREDIKDSIKDQMEQVDADAQHKKDKIQSQIDSLNELMGAWGNSTQQMLNNILSQKEAQEWLDEFQSASASKRKQMLEELDEAYYDMVQSELDMNNQRIEDLENLKNDFQEDYDEIKASMDEYRIAEEDLNEFLQLSIEDRKEWLKDLTSTWKSEISSMIAEINRLKAAMNSLEGASVGGGGGGGSSSSGGSSSGSSTNKSPLSPSDYDAVSKLNPVDNPELADKAGEVWDAIVSGNKSEAVQNAIDKAQGKKNKKSYAKGGTRIVDYTGWEKGMANTWVDGTPLKPEVVLNNTDAKKLYDMVHNAPSFNGDNEPNENVVFNIANLELPNVTNASTFVDDLKSYSVNHAIQLSKCRR